jgi:hypothetical protein
MKIISYEESLKLKFPGQIVGGGKFDWSLGCYIDGNQCAVMIICVNDGGSH